MSEHIAGATKKVYNGVEYNSTLEATTAETLDKMGISWEYESKTYTLQEGFYCPWQKRKVLAITYTPDFFIGPVMIETKGWKTPDFKLKEKMFYKHLMNNEPNAIYYIVKNSKQLLEVLDKHLLHLGYAVKVTQKPKGKKDKPVSLPLYDSIQQAMEALNLKGKSIGPIIGSLTGDKQYVYGYNWSLLKINSLL